MCFKSLVSIRCRLGFKVSQLLSNNTLVNAVVLNMSSRKYCMNTYQRDNESRMPRMLLPRMVSCKPCPEWRKQWIKHDHQPKLSAFNEKNPTAEISNVMDKVQNLDMEQVHKRWKSIKELQEIENQKYLPHRTEVLGANIAALHFFTYRNAAVRLKDSEDWIAGGLETLTEVLPHNHEEGYYVEAIDCSTYNPDVRYEGLQNLAGLDHLKWLSLKNQKRIDAWCLDRIAGQNGITLEYLDISSCTLNPSCVLPLTRMPKLQTLIIKDPVDDNETQAALSYLEYKLPTCIIKAVNDNYELVCSKEDYFTSLKD